MILLVCLGGVLLHRCFLLFERLDNLPFCCNQLDPFALHFQPLHVYKYFILKEIIQLIFEAQLVSLLG